MSLINQMLKDLEERSAPQLDEHADTIKGVAWTAPTASNKNQRYFWATIITSILCTGLAVAGYYHINNSAEPQVQMGESKEPAIIAEVKTDKLTSSDNIASFATEPQTDGASNIIATDKDKTANDVNAAKGTEARKMLAALVARGALVEKNATINKTEIVTKKPIQLAVRDNAEKNENNTSVQKKLRPLGNKKLAEIAYQQGYELIAVGQQAVAEKKLQHALELANTHTKAREILAVLYLRQQRVPEAASLLKEGMRVSPGYLPFREIYARTLMAQKQLPEAIELLNKNAPDLNQQPNYFALLAGLYQQNQQHEQAAATYLRLVKKNPQQSQWWLGMAISLEKMGKNVEAISAYKKAQTLKLPARLMKYVDSRLQQLGASHAAEP